MAIYHLTVKAFGRSRGQSATAAAAYRSAARIRDERTGEIHDFSRKGGVLHRELVLPDGAPAWASDRERLWNAAERSEHRKNSTVAREFEVALPSELGTQERTALAVDLARAIAQRHRCAVDVSVHRPGRGGDTRNHHAHLLCTTRRLTGNGFQDKTRELDDLKSGEVVFWRERWATLANERLRARGCPGRVDHRTLKAQGIDREPTVHKGPLLTAIERRGLQVEITRRRESDRQQEEQARLQRAAEFARLEEESRHLQGLFIALSTDMAAARQVRDQPRAGPAEEPTDGLSAWRESARRRREAALQKSQEREAREHDKQREKGRDGGRDGPDYER